MIGISTNNRTEEPRQSLVARTRYAASRVTHQALRQLLKQAIKCGPSTLSYRLGEVLTRFYADTFEFRSCPTCGERDFEYKYTGWKPLPKNLYPGSLDFPRYAQGIFPLIYVECKGCHSGYINPSPKRAWIDNEFDVDRQEMGLANWMDTEEYIADKRKSISYHHKRLQLERFRSERSSVLDISCGSGVGLEVLGNDFGWLKLVGVECDGLAVSYGRNKRSLDIRQGFIYDADFESHSFDLVIMDNSLEHHSTPKKALDKVRRLLQPKGALFIVVPNFHGKSVVDDGVDYCNLGWGHWSYFTVQSLACLLQGQGFTVERAYSGSCRPDQMKDCSHKSGVCLDLEGEAVNRIAMEERVFQGDFIHLLARTN